MPPVAPCVQEQHSGEGSSASARRTPGTTSRTRSPRRGSRSGAAAAMGGPFQIMMFWIFEGSHHPHACSCTFLAFVFLSRPGGPAAAGFGGAAGGAAGGGSAVEGRLLDFARVSHFSSTSARQSPIVDDARHGRAAPSASCRRRRPKSSIIVVGHHHSSSSSSSHIAGAPPAGCSDGLTIRAQTRGRCRDSGNQHVCSLFVRVFRVALSVTLQFCCLGAVDISPGHSQTCYGVLMIATVADRRWFVLNHR